LGEFPKAELRRLSDSLDLMITYDPIRHAAQVRITLATIDGTLEDSCPRQGTDQILAARQVQLQ
jgi:hypothetical protein